MLIDVQTQQSKRSTQVTYIQILCMTMNTIISYCHCIFLFVILLSLPVDACNKLNKRDCRHDGSCIWNKAELRCMGENDIVKVKGGGRRLPKWDWVDKRCRDISSGEVKVAQPDDCRDLTRKQCKQDNRW